MEDWLKRYGAWIFRGVVVLFIVILFMLLNSARRERAELSKQLEAEKLTTAKFTVEMEATKGKLTQAEANIVKNDAAFAEEKARLEKLLGGKPKVVTVVQWVTAPVITYPWQAGDPPRECPQPDATGKKKDILVIEGDTGHVAVSEVTYETKENNHVFIATGTCWRDTPTPRILFQSAVQGLAPVALREKEATPFQWGAALLVVGTSDKLGLGGSVLFPTFEFLGLQWDPSAGAAFSTSGFTAAQVQFGARGR